MATSSGRLFQAKESFFYDVDGTAQVVSVGQLVREGHPILDGREDLFKLHDSIMEIPEDHTPKRRPGRPAKTDK